MDNLAVNLGADYNTWANDEVFLAVQIETAQGLANVDAIMATDGVDGCLVGPTDLALSLGVAQGSPEHTAGIHLVLQACRQAGKIAGMFAGTTAIARPPISARDARDRATPSCACGWRATRRRMISSEIHKRRQQVVFQPV